MPRGLLYVFAAALAATWAATLASPANARTVDLFGASVEIPVAQGECAHDGSDPSTRTWFGRAAAVQQRVGNKLQLIVINCNETPIITGQRGGNLSNWTMIYMSRTRHSIGPNVSHAAYSTQYCRSLPGFIARSGKGISDDVSRAAKDVYGFGMSTNFQKPFAFDDSCLIPLRSNLPNGTVYGLFTPIVTQGRVFFVSTYSYTKSDFPNMVEKLMAWSKSARGTVGGPSGPVTGAPQNAPGGGEIAPGPRSRARSQFDDEQGSPADLLND